MVEGKFVERVEADANIYPGRQKFLVVEDDVVIQPIWSRILDLVDPNAIIFWATTEELAEKMIRERIELKDKFDFVVADVILEGPKNGVDLWRRFGRGDTLFLFASSVTPKKLSEMIGGTEERQPFLVRKPLDPQECVESVRAMLSYRGTFTRKDSM